ncbi:MAG: TetR-like C-terminal domain-containing protein [Pseudomonadota bacterium]|nr:TetR-like C-terminal domain-containing protein [Pseudomonadota bacterium]
MADDKRYHHGNLKPALVQAGLDILREQGLERLSLRACAERVGVSHMAPKNHFGNVTGLLSAISAEGFVALKAEMEHGLGEAPTRSERRDAAFRGYVAFAKANPALFELMFTRRLVDFTDPVLKGPMSDCAAILRQLSAGMIWDKDAAPDADMRAQMLNWCIVHGFAQLSVQGVFDKDGMRHLGIEDITPDVAYRD